MTDGSVMISDAASGCWFKTEGRETREPGDSFVDEDADDLSCEDSLKRLFGPRPSCTCLQLSFPNRYIVSRRPVREIWRLKMKECKELCEILEEQLHSSDVTDLRYLLVRDLSSASNFSGLLWEFLHCSAVTELDLSECALNKVADEIQFWSTPNLTSLWLNGNNLKWLPASIGKLTELKLLCANDNCLSSLPHSIIYCTSLEELNLERNCFSSLPGSILRIDSLETLRRHGNTRMHNTAADHACVARQRGYITVKREHSVAADQSMGAGEVSSLKLLAVHSVLRNKLDYWSDSAVAPVLCKVLDLTQAEYRVCDQCCNSVHRDVPGFQVQWLMESFKGLKHVPFEHFACSLVCARALERSFRKLQRRLKVASDRRYQEYVERYTLEAEEAERGARKSRQRRRSRRLRVTETWPTDMHIHSTRTPHRGGRGLCKCSLM